MSTRAQPAGWIRGLVVPLVGVVVGAVLFTTPSTSSARLDGGGGSTYKFKDAEICFMSRVNRARRAHGLRRLDWDKQLGYVARRHAQRMARGGGVWHHGSLGSEVTRWRRLAQNVGRGRSCRSLMRAFMSSRIHRSNILGQWRHIGVGIEKHNGKVYVQHVFESRRDPGNIYSWP